MLFSSWLCCCDGLYAPYSASHVFGPVLLTTHASQSSASLAVIWIDRFAFVIVDSCPDWHEICPGNHILCESHTSLHFRERSPHTVSIHWTADEWCDLSISHPSCGAYHCDHDIGDGSHFLQPPRMACHRIIWRNNVIFWRFLFIILTCAAMLCL